MLSIPRRLHATAAWILLALAMTLAMSAQAQFDQNRLAQKWDAWQRPSLIAVVGARDAARLCRAWQMDEISTAPPVPLNQSARARGRCVELPDPQPTT